MFCIAKKPLLIFLLPITVFNFILYKFKIINKLKFKEKFFSFLKYIDNIESLIKLFWLKNIYKIKKWFREDKNINRVIISASPEFLLNPIIKEINVKHIIASKVDIKTGKFNSNNCYGIEKVNRLNKLYTNYKIVNFYSDSLSDIHLAKISKNSYLVKKNIIKKWNV